MPLSLRLQGGPADGTVYQADPDRALFEIRRFERPALSLAALTEGTVGAESVPTISRSFYRLSRDQDNDGNRIAYHVAGF